MRENLSSTFCQLVIEAPSPPGLDQSAWQGYAADSVINLERFLRMATRHVAGCIAWLVRHPCTTAQHGQTEAEEPAEPHGGHDPVGLRGYPLDLTRGAQDDACRALPRGE